MSSPVDPTNGNTPPTPEQNASAIALLTSAVDTLVSQFIRPSAQQANANRERLDRIEDLLDRHAQAIVQIDERLERLEGIVSAIAQQQQTNTDGVTDLQVLHRENQQSLQILIDEGRTDRQAQREALRAILTNSQRIDQLEQQAS